MTQLLRTHFLPQMVNPESLPRGTAVVVDILRATTCIVQALASGARQIVPVLEVAEAREMAAEHPDYLLAGERQGRPIAGFDLGNSPSEFAPSRVAGRTLIMTTTNGTRAVHRCQAASCVWMGAFLNLSRLAQSLGTQAGPVDIVCAGTDGQVTREDVLFAGALAQRLADDAAARWQIDDATRMAIDVWRAAHVEDADQLARQFQVTQGGRNLLALGQAADLAWCARLDGAPLLARAMWPGHNGPTPALALPRVVIAAEPESLPMR